MYCEEFGQENDRVVVMLHGAFFTFAFGRQYCLADRYHIVVPHIMGFGRHTDRTFQTDEALAELEECVGGLGRKAGLVGFSLGAQLGYALICRRPDLFDKTVLVSPWLEKDAAEMQGILRENERQLKSLQNRAKCSLIALTCGVPGEQRREFVRNMQNVSAETVRNSVDNGIELTDEFRDIPVPVMALCGGREPDGVVSSVRGVGALNPLCQAQVWPKAAHNIPPMFAREFNRLLGDFL